MRNVWSVLSTVGALYQRRQTIRDYPRPSETKQNQLRGQTMADQDRPGQSKPLNIIQYHPILYNTIFIHCASQMAFFSPHILSSCTSWSHVKNRTELNIKHQAKTQESRYDDDQSGLLTARSKLSEVVYLVAIRAKGSSSAKSLTSRDWLVLVLGHLPLETDWSPEPSNCLFLSQLSTPCQWNLSESWLLTLAILLGGRLGATIILPNRLDQTYRSNFWQKNHRKTSRMVSGGRLRWVRTSIFWHPSLTIWSWDMKPL